MTVRFFRYLFLLLAFVAGLRASQAQAKPAGVGAGLSVQAGGGFGTYYLAYGQRWLQGPHVWVDIDFHQKWSVEAEGQWLIYNQDEDVHASTVLVGPRYVRKSEHVELYAKGLVGRGNFNFPFNYATGQYFVVAGGGGVDLKVGQRLRVRMIDLEYQSWPKFSFGGLAPYGVSTGISFVIFRPQ